MFKFKNISFGATSAVMTSLAVIIGLSSTENARIGVITMLLIIAIADNISDSFGMHIHQESLNEPPKEVRNTTIINFFSRLLIVTIFILLIFFLPQIFAIISSIILGIIVITLLSYYIAIEQKINPYKAIFQHLTLALIVMLGSYILKEAISKLFLKF